MAVIDDAPSSLQPLARDACSRVPQAEMGLIQIPRVAAAVARGYMRRGTPVDKTLGIASTHISRRRAGPFDFDVYGHMNNAAFLVHFEMARWELGAQNGFIDWSVQQRAALIVGGASVRFRKEIPPFKAFEVHSKFAAFDERWFYVSQTMQPRGGGKVRDHACASSAAPLSRRGSQDRPALATGLCTVALPCGDQARAGDVRAPGRSRSERTRSRDDRDPGERFQHEGAARGVRRPRRRAQGSGVGYFGKFGLYERRLLGGWGSSSGHGPPVDVRSDISTTGKPKNSAPNPRSFSELHDPIH